MRIINEISRDLSRITQALNEACPESLRIYSRKLAKAEMELQAARSLLEARLFAAEIDSMEKSFQDRIEESEHG